MRSFTNFLEVLFWQILRFCGVMAWALLLLSLPLLPCIFHAFPMHSTHVHAFFTHSPRILHAFSMHSPCMSCILHACIPCIYHALITHVAHAFSYISCMLIHLHLATHDPRNFLENWDFFLVFSWPILCQQNDRFSFVFQWSTCHVRASDFSGGLQVPHRSCSYSTSVLRASATIYVRFSSL